MSKIEFTYEHLDNAQQILDSINANKNQFDWGIDWDWKKNILAIQRILSDVFYGETPPFYISYHTLNGDDYFAWLQYYDTRMHCMIEAKEEIETDFEFDSPLDVLSLLDEYASYVNEVKAFYQIKVA